jgi:glycosyltransferase involved in cell wall biosynthesis
VIKVSVIMAVYNGAATIARALDSAFAQREAPAFEMIVANDGSTDATAEILERYAGRVLVIAGERRGNGPARNRAIQQHAQGEHLAFLDADDVWLPDKLARTVPVLDRDPGCVLVYSNGTLIDRAGRVLGPYVGPESAHAPALDEMFNYYWPIVESMTVMRRLAFDQAGGFWEEPGAYRANGVGFLWMRMRELGHFHYIPEPLVMLEASDYPDYIEKNAAGRKVFARLVRERYGAAASRRLMRGMNRAIKRDHRHNLGYLGLVAMREGRTADARQFFMRAVRQNPTDIKNALRLVRTFLPASMGRALTGRSRGT